MAISTTRRRTAGCSRRRKTRRSRCGSTCGFVLRIAELFARATPEQRAALRNEMERAARALPPDDRAALTRFAALFGGVTGPEGAAGREARLRLAVHLVEGSDRSQIIPGLLELAALKRQAGDGAFAARTLEARACALAAHGVIEDATACYRTLARDFAGVKLPSGLTGTQAFAELAADKRFLPHVETMRPRWEGRRLDKVESNDPFAAPSLVLVDPFLTASASSRPTRSTGSRLPSCVSLSHRRRSATYALSSTWPVVGCASAAACPRKNCGASRCHMRKPNSIPSQQTPASRPFPAGIWKWDI